MTYNVFSGTLNPAQSMFCAVLCATVVHSAMHTHMNRHKSCLLVRLWLYCVLQFICVRFSIWGLFCLMVYLCICAFVVLDLVSSVLCQEID